MDRKGATPFYLSCFLLRIRRHSGEEDYLAKRHQSKKRDTVEIEVVMLRELQERGLINLSSPEIEFLFDKSGKPMKDTPAARLISGGTSTPGYEMFTIAPAGKYFLRESMVGAAGRIAVAFVSALVGLLVGLLVGGLD